MTSSWKHEPQFLALKKDFVASLRERGEKLERLLEGIQSGLSLNQLADEYYFLVHKLAGVARSFDLVDLADLVEAEDEAWSIKVDLKENLSANELKQSIEKVLKLVRFYSCKT